MAQEIGDVMAQEARGEQLLFSDNRSKDLSRSVSRWFCGEGNKKGYRHRCEVDLSDEQRKVFHSFRNNFTTSLKNSGVAEEICAEFIGHKQSITFDVYTEKLPIERKFDLLENVNYPSIDFDQIRKW